MLAQGRNIQRDQLGMRGHPSHLPPPASPCPMARLAPAQGWVEPSSGSGSRHLPEARERPALQRQSVGQGMAEVAEGVTSCCRSVPQAWWMKTPSNSFTRSSSLREVSLRPGVHPRPPPAQALQRVGIPFTGRGGTGGGEGGTHHDDDDLHLHLYPPCHPLPSRPGAASVLLEGGTSAQDTTGTLGRSVWDGIGARAAREPQNTPALVLALTRCYHLRALPVQCLRCRRERGHPLRGRSLLTPPHPLSLQPSAGVIVLPWCHPFEAVQRLRHGPGCNWSSVSPRERGDHAWPAMGPAEVRGIACAVWPPPRCLFFHSSAARPREPLRRTEVVVTHGNLHLKRGQGLAQRSALGWRFRPPAPEFTPWPGSRQRASA